MQTNIQKSLIYNIHYFNWCSVLAPIMSVYYNIHIINGNTVFPERHKFFSLKYVIYYRQGAGLHKR